jgi:hypothetical protein
VSAGVTHGNVFKTFDALAQGICQDLAGRTAIVDGEIVRPGPDGRALFYELMRRRGPFCFGAFDLVWLDGRDLRNEPLLDRKARLRKLVPQPAGAVFYVDYVSNGAVLFRVILRPGHGRHRSEAGEGRIHAGSDDLGQDQPVTAESPLGVGHRTQGGVAFGARD